MQATRGAPLSGGAQQTRRRRRLSLSLFVGVAAVLYAVDQTTKAWAVRRLQDRDIEVFGDVFSLHLVFNPGAAFGTGTGYTGVFTTLAIVAVILILWFSRRVASPLWGLGLGFLLAGVAGNLTDRLFRDPGPFVGHVVDFLRFPNFPVFNVADICINIAAGLIILQTFRGISLEGTRIDQAEAAQEGAKE